MFTCIYIILGPGSSETDDNELGVVEEVELVPNGNLATPIHKLVVEEEEEETTEMSARIVHKTTPPSVSRSSPTTYTNRPPSSITSKATPTTGKGTQIGSNSAAKTRPNLGGKRQVGGTRVFDKESNNESQTSDTEMTSTSALSLSSQKGTGVGGGRRKFDSDLSTAPFSSETSDMSEGERGLGRKGSPPPNPPSSGISRPSPKLSHKAISVDSTQIDVKAEATPSKVEATPTAKGSARPVKAGNFVSKRTSVLAMVSQFDSGPNKKPENEGTGSARTPPTRPHPPVKSAISAKPNPRPKPPGMTNKQVSPPRATPTKTTPTEEGSNGEKKADKPTKAVNSRLSSVASSGRAKSSTDCTSGDSSSSHNEGGVVSARSSVGSGHKLSKGSTSTVNTSSKGSDTLKSVKGNDADSKSDTKSVASNDSDDTKSTDGSVGGASKQVGGANKPARPAPPKGVHVKKPTTTTTSSTNRLSTVKTTPKSGRSSPVASSNVGGASPGTKLKVTNDIQLLGNKVKPNGGGGAVGGVKRTRPSFSNKTGSSDKSTKPTLTKNSISLPLMDNDSKENLVSKSPPVPVERKSPPTPVEKKVLLTPADKKVPPTPTEKAPPTPSNKKPPLTPIDKKPPIIERKSPLISKLSTDEKSPPVEKKVVSTSDKKPEALLDIEGEEPATKELLEKCQSIKRPSPRRPPPEPPSLSPPPLGPKSPPVVRKVSPPTNKSSVAPPLPPPPKSISSKATPSTPPSQRALPPTPVGQKLSLQKATPPSQKPPPRPPKLSDSKDQAQNYEEFVPTLNRSSSMSSQTGPPSPVLLSPNECHYEGVSITPAFTIGSGKKSSQSSDSETPPPLPPRNYNPDDSIIPRVISLPVALTTVDERDGPTTPTSVGPFPSLDDAPPPLPTQPIPKRKSLLSHMPPPSSSSPLLKRKEIPASLIRTSPTLPSRFTPPSNRINIYEEINIGPSPFRSRSSSASSSLKRIEQHYEVSDSYRSNESPKARTGLVRTSSSGQLLLILVLLHVLILVLLLILVVTLLINLHVLLIVTLLTSRVDDGLINMHVCILPLIIGSGSTTSSDDPRRFSASICVTSSLGVSPVSVRRANSDSKSEKVSIVVTGAGDEPQRRSSIQRTSSMDALDERKYPRASITDPGYSSGEEEDHHLSLRNGEFSLWM